MSGIMYSMKTKSQGNVMGPLLGSSKSSSDILKSSLKMLLLRYTKGIIKRLWSAVYTTKWPLLATDVLQLSASTLIFVVDEEILFLPRTAILCHFLAILMIFLGLIMLPYPVYYGLTALRKKRKENSDLRTLKCFCWCWVVDNGSQLCLHKVQDTPLIIFPHVAILLYKTMVISYMFQISASRCIPRTGFHPISLCALRTHHIQFSWHQSFEVSLTVVSIYEWFDFLLLNIRGN